jgi:acyl-CoA reductase-like NAD-dependent aldehyde dehydrogenase
MTQYNPFAVQLFIGNEYLSSHQNVRDVINPSTLQPCGRIADATPAEIDRALSWAEAARPDWARLDAKTRAQFLHAVAQSIETRDTHDVARMMTLEVGKPYPESVGELANVASAFRHYAEIARDDAGKIAGPIQFGSFQYALYFPCGVSVHIVRRGHLQGRKLRLSLWQIPPSSVSAPTSLSPNSPKPCRPWKKSKLGWCG